MLRSVGIEPPKFHDVGDLLLEHRQFFPTSLSVPLEDLARISKWLRKERELSMYGDIDFIPTEEYTSEQAQRAIDDAERVVRAAREVITA
jgi:HEPN domain-containing protein